MFSFISNKTQTTPLSVVLNLPKNYGQLMYNCIMNIKRKNKNHSLLICFIFLSSLHLHYCCDMVPVTAIKRRVKI